MLQFNLLLWKEVPEYGSSLIYHLQSRIHSDLPDMTATGLGAFINEPVTSDIWLSPGLDVVTKPACGVIAEI